MENDSLIKEMRLNLTECFGGASNSKSKVD